MTTRSAEGLRLVEFGQLNRKQRHRSIAIPRSWPRFSDGQRCDFDDESVETMRMLTQQERERSRKRSDESDGRTIERSRFTLECCSHDYRIEYNRARTPKRRAYDVANDGGGAPKWRFIAQRDYYICREVEPEDSWRNRSILADSGHRRATASRPRYVRRFASNPTTTARRCVRRVGPSCDSLRSKSIDEAERAARRQLRTSCEAQGYGLVYLDDGSRRHAELTEDPASMLFDRPDVWRPWLVPLKLAGVQI